MKREPLINIYTQVVQQYHWHFQFHVVILNKDFILTPCFEHGIFALAYKCALLSMPLLHVQNLTNLRGLETESPHLTIVKVDVELHQFKTPLV